MEKRKENFIFSWYLTLYIISFGVLWLWYFFFDFNLKGILFYSSIYFSFATFCIYVIYKMKSRGEYHLKLHAGQG
jgi:hypothetical protein